MIVTKRWLNEFIDIEDLSVSDICKTLNSIGLEVDSVAKLSAPKGVVVGEVLECEKHKDADKLNVTKVDVGDEILQIVCGAKNVAKGQLVAVATVGSDLGEGFVIKEAKLRGVDSFGMICAADEITPYKLNDGIWVLDESLGELTPGRELSNIIEDDIIEIELTANRGDALSIYGVARDLSAALNRDLREFNFRDRVKKSSKMEIKNSFKEISLSYVRGGEIRSSALIDLRVSLIDRYEEAEFKRVLTYATHSIGVLFRGYKKEYESIRVDLDSDDIASVFADGNLISRVGISQVKEFEGEELIEASYIDPDFVSTEVMAKEIEKDALFYNSSRGSESDLLFGFGYLSTLLNREDMEVSISNETEFYAKEISLTLSKIDNFVGQKIDRDRVADIFEKLRFSVEREDDEIRVKVPTFRHDIKHEQDLIEEIVRMVGIDNIVSTPLLFKQKNIINDSYIAYKKRNFYRSKASCNFFESIHYFFDNRELMERFGFDRVKEDADLLNPITNELNTLRSTLLLHLINSASKNIKNSKRRANLFEIGRVVDENRKEREKIAFIHSGEVGEANIENGGKPKEIDFLTFADMVASVLGEVELRVGKEENRLVNPYEYARVILDGEDIGFMARVHADVEREFDLKRAYICEVDFSSLKYEKVLVEDYSKFPSLSRDLSLVVPKSMRFSAIKEALGSLLPKEVISFYPIDIYEDSKLGDSVSMTIRFILQSFEKTLNESEITTIMEEILKVLKDSLKLELR
jgi:phenylalanyl-tRNA synthetase beta chain